MPAYTYLGSEPRHYPELRDLDGAIVGAVQPGAQADLAEAPPDGMWAVAGETPDAAPAEDAPEAAEAAPEAVTAAADLAGEAVPAGFPAP